MPGYGIKAFRVMCFVFRVSRFATLNFKLLDCNCCCHCNCNYSAPCAFICVLAVMFGSHSVVIRSFCVSSSGFQVPRFRFVTKIIWYALELSNHWYMQLFEIDRVVCHLLDANAHSILIRRLTTGFKFPSNSEFTWINNHSLVYYNLSYENKLCACVMVKKIL